MAAVLIGMSAEVKGKNHDLVRDKVSIGRNATNMIVLEHPTVSGRHCCITRDGERYVLTDLGSTNGTRVNAREITEIELKPKDLVQVGSLEFMFDAEGVKVEDSHSYAQTQVEVTSGPATAPISFGSISPFGARRKDNSALWYTIIIAIGLLALATIVVLVIKLMSA